MLLPYGRMENFFKEVFGLEISQESFVNWVSEARKKHNNSSYAAIRALF